MLQRLTDDCNALSLKIKKVYDVFRNTIKHDDLLTLAYSGGKDSTVLAILLYRWLCKRRVRSLIVNIVHNDTLSEITPMEVWARKFMDEYSQRLRQIGYNVNVFITTPPANETFYWRVIVRGYPAPTYNFRWCVKLLKMRPTEKTVSSLPPGIIMTGLREYESASRKKVVKQRYGSCSLGPGKCTAYYFTKANIDGVIKVAPLRDWSNDDVWTFLRNIDDFQISDLLYLYGCEEARYGCWHCTLIKTQWGLRVLGGRYLYLEAARLLYRKLSDLREARTPKKTGYSKVGALNVSGRAIMLFAFKAAEELSGLKLYGLDEAKVKEGYTLRQVFYEIDGDEAMNIIYNNDPHIPRRRIIPIKELKDLNKHRRRTELIVTKLKKQATSEQQAELIEAISQNM